ncbi:TOBE domain-containing protein [Turicimonas muris]|uniref:TOBE domain-containing protein n=1 Tax=Turicimonas muris TaxID=1796652 RepID=UPI0023F1C080|nr:TOBE domain-containing protein [Turicimonas muris]
MNIFDALGLESVDKRIDILQRIDSLGSISQAARSAGISYKAAWQAIETLSNLAGEPLVEKAVGGSFGGGAVLTPAGRLVLEASASLNKVRSQILMDIENGQHSKLASLAASTLKMSVRNVIPCLIEEIHGGLSQSKVVLKVAEHAYLKASITTESQQLLGLKMGMTVLALFKATGAKILDSLPENYDKEVLKGQVARLPQRDKGGEVTLRLANGINVVGFVHSPHTLTIGSDAYLEVDQTSVIIGLM